MAKTPTDIRSLARSHTETALTTLAGIMMQPRAPAAARVSAATALLDRGWGKPPQTYDEDHPFFDPGFWFSWIQKTQMHQLVDVTSQEPHSSHTTNGVNGSQKLLPTDSAEKRSPPSTNSFDED